MQEPGIGSEYCFPCTQCGKSYKWKRNLIQHVKNECGKEPQFFCPHCNFKAKHSFNLYRHLRKVHSVEVVCSRGNSTNQYRVDYL